MSATLILKVGDATQDECEQKDNVSKQNVQISEGEPPLEDSLHRFLTTESIQPKIDECAKLEFW